MTDINRLSVKIAGPAGEGILSAGHVFAKCCLRGGLFVVTENERPSLIRGGHNQFMIRAEEREINSHINLYNLLLALDKDSVLMHAGELSHCGGIIYDSESILLEPHEISRDDLRLFAIPMRTIMKELKAGPIVENVIALGAAMAVLDYDLSILLQILKEEYGKHSEALKLDLVAAQRGYDFIKEHHGAPFTNQLRPIKDAPKRMLINGLAALNLGAVKAGVGFLSQYPMTPSTGVIQGLTGIAEQYRIGIVQTEDEIASMNMALGAGFAGVRSMTATSGGGFALMNEALSLGGMTETPVVTVIVTRGNPATGLPTRTEQSDLQFVLNSGHGEFPHIVIAPCCPIACYRAAQRAFNLADKYQTPVTILLDRHVAETFHTIERLPDDIPIDRGYWQEGNGPRYTWNDETGISPRIIPGTPGKRFRTTGNEHDQTGLMNDDRSTRTRMMEKRLRKMVVALNDLPPPKLHGPEDAPITIVSWGSTRPIIADARSFLEQEGIMTNHLHITYLQPMHADVVSDILNKVKNPILVENNATGLFGKLIRQETGFEIKKKVLQYDGWPFSPDKLAGRLKELM